MDFEKLQTEKEVKSLCQQITLCTNINKQARVPLNLTLTCVEGTIKQ
jgi:tRNA (guanine9-N1)-methyltransferase